jgi:hypothetical protein
MRNQQIGAAEQGVPVRPLRAQDRCFFNTVLRSALAAAERQAVGLHLYWRSALPIDAGVSAMTYRGERKVIAANRLPCHGTLLNTSLCGMLCRGKHIHSVASRCRIVAFEFTLSHARCRVVACNRSSPPIECGIVANEYLPPPIDCRVVAVVHCSDVRMLVSWRSLGRVVERVPCLRPLSCRRVPSAVVWRSREHRPIELRRSGEHLSAWRAECRIVANDMTQPRERRCIVAVERCWLMRNVEC